MTPQAPDTNNTLRAYLDAHEVELIPVHPNDTGHPGIALPRPDGWVEVARGVFPQAHTVIIAPEYTVDDWTPNAVLLHGRLSRWRPTDELLDIAATETRALSEWLELHSSTADFNGHRSVFVHGTYRAGNEMLEAATRYVVIDHEHDRCLTQLTVTTRAHSPVDLATSAVAIHTGLSVEMAPDDSARLLSGRRNPSRKDIRAALR
ncbi:LpqN/LpqT family lipoprotein [Rhodococcus zopfii]|uniref:LpqN/LpqT family lipoprotein n=1 Tax=Rhodococcus zopfii TaxID=43772 RepID=UPI001111422D|nr:LpqN/LpqT family lipoprotein [Rhodococcus zopfii]